MTTQQDYIYNAAINAINSHFKFLKWGIVGLVAGWPLIYFFAGSWGVAGIGVFVVVSIGDTYRLAAIAARKIEKGDRALLWDYTPEEKRDDLTRAFAAKKQSTPALPPNQQPITNTSTSQSASNQYSWFDNFLEYPTVLIWGPQGSGKSTLAKYLVHLRQERGHNIEIIDPHYKAGDWQGFAVVGKGMNYCEVQTKLTAIIKKSREIYRQRATDVNWQPTPQTYVIEELTNYAENVPIAGQFFKISLSDFRKAGICIVYIAHDTSLLAMGGSKGTGKQKKGLMNLQLNVTVHPATKKAFPQFSGLLTLPQSTPVEVAIDPDWRVEESPLSTGGTSDDENSTNQVPPTSPPISTGATTTATSGDSTSATTRDRVASLIAEGKSDNEICKIFEATKNSRKYHEIKDLIRDIRECNGTKSYHPFSGII